MTPVEAQQIIDTLAKGLDPETGAALPADSCLNSPPIIRALFLASQALGTSTQRTRANDDRPGKAGKPWSDAEDEQLIKAFDAGVTVRELANIHERSVGGINSRLVRLGRIDNRSEALDQGC